MSAKKAVAASARLGRSRVLFLAIRGAAVREGRMPGPIVLAVYHDVLSAWCFLTAGRLRNLKQQVGDRIRIEGRVFPAAPKPEDYIQHFGSAARAKAEILKEWKAVAREPGGERINAPLMASQPFPYPASLPPLAAVKAAERQGGMLAHDTYFDHAQEAHLIQCRNVADRHVLLDLAHDLVLDLGHFEAHLDSGECDRAVLAAAETARARGIQRTPTVVFDDRWALPGAVPVETYLAVLQDLLAGRDPRETAPTAKEGWTLRRPYPIPPGG